MIHYMCKARPDVVEVPVPDRRFGVFSRVRVTFSDFFVDAKFRCKYGSVNPMIPFF